MTSEAPLIVVVDDDVDFLEWNTYVLADGGYRVRLFSDPDTAFENMVAESPDLVITDLMMESLDSGFSFARRIKADRRFNRTRVVLVTAAESQRGFDFRPNTPEELEAMGADAFFCKPVDPKALLAKIRELLAPTDRPKGGA